MRRNDPDRLEGLWRQAQLPLLPTLLLRTEMPEMPLADDDPLSAESSHNVARPSEETFVRLYR